MIICSYHPLRAATRLCFSLTGPDRAVSADGMVDRAICKRLFCKIADLLAILPLLVVIMYHHHTELSMVAILEIFPI